MLHVGGHPGGQQARSDSGRLLRISRRGGSTDLYSILKLRNHNNIHHNSPECQVPEAVTFISWRNHSDVLATCEFSGCRRRLLWSHWVWMSDVGDHVLLARRFRSTHTFTGDLYRECLRSLSGLASTIPRAR